MNYPQLKTVRDEQPELDGAAFLAWVNAPVWTPRDKFIDNTELSHIWGAAKQFAFSYAVEQAITQAPTVEGKAAAYGLSKLLTGRGFWAADPQVTDTWLQTFVALGSGTISMEDARAAVSTSVPRFVSLGIAVPSEVEAITDDHIAAAARVAMVQERIAEVEDIAAYALNEILNPMKTAAATGDVMVPSLAEIIQRWGDA